MKINSKDFHCAARGKSQAQRSADKCKPFCKSKKATKNSWKNTLTR